MSPLLEIFTEKIFISELTRRSLKLNYAFVPIVFRGIDLITSAKIYHVLIYWLIIHAKSNKRMPF